jgi:glucose-6-phosphate dehydrogenase assembly protein OpcA
MTATELPLRDVERELARERARVKPPDGPPTLLACMSNLIVFCNGSEQAEKLSKELPAIVALHPARVLLVIAEPGPPDKDVRAGIEVWCKEGENQTRICTEEIALRAQGACVAHLPFAVRELLMGDLPTNLWWTAPQPPPLAGPMLADLTEHVQQVIFDSHGWTEPHRGVAMAAAWLEHFERGPQEGGWRVASDLNWRRLKYWRRLLAQAFDPALVPGALESIREVLVEHGPHAVTQAWQLVGWLASRLHWKVQTAKVQPGVEFRWQVATPQGKVAVCVHRLPDGPAEVRHVRIACSLDGKPGAVDVSVQDDRRLAATLNGSGRATRTLTVPPSSIADLVARQLSDRERDPVFRESMAVAQVFAQSAMH